MLSISIFAVGPLRDAAYRNLAAEYEKRFKPFGRLTVREVGAEPFTQTTRDIAMRREGDRLQKALVQFADATVVRLAETGTEYDSPGLARWLEARTGHIVFVVGGALGFSPEIIKAVPAALSLSRLTMPHELARVVLLEQLYRAGTIIKGKTYHY